MKVRLTLAALLWLSCAPLGPTALTPNQLRSRASRPIPAPFDEAFDATWLALELLGWTVTEHDGRAGTLETSTVLQPNGTGRAWTASVSQEGASPLVTLLPRVFHGPTEVTAQMHWTLEGPGGEGERWEQLFTQIRALVDTWRAHPELVLSASRGEVDAAGLRLLVPSWRHFEFSVDRRTLVMKGVGSTLAPTLLYRVERRRPQTDLAQLVHEALERAAHSRGQVAEPAQWEVLSDEWGQTAEGEVLVGADLTPSAVRWRWWEARSPAWVVRVAGVCPPQDAACDRDLRAVVESAVNTSAAVPGFKTR